MKIGQEGVTNKLRHNTTSKTGPLTACSPLISPLPFVSVVIPCYNEERFIGKVLENLADQYDSQRYEMIIVDGMSVDGTRRVIDEFSKVRPDVAIKLIDNPARTIPTALNLGIAAARGDIIARMDAHAIPSKNYIRRCVEILQQDQAGVVGMPCRVCPGADTLMAQAIAVAVSHPFGIGDAKYRLREATSAQEAVDTVAFGCFNKETWSEIGGFNEELLTNEDYDFNYRVRLRGKPILLDRSEHCDYFARTTLKGLASQYSRYGSWKARMVRLHPRSIRFRHMVAPIFVLSLIMLAIVGFWWSPAWWVLALEVATYALLSVLFGIQAALRVGGGLLLALIMPVTFFTIQVTWGTNFLFGLIRPPR
jgi:glycosyltransferase involved in cell wall biosynthesis